MKQFVKHGKEGQLSFVEVDIFITDDVITIKREINSDTKSSKWFLNRKSSSKEKIKQELSSLSIDVDNLCSFMPQDKVGNFTRFTPKEILQNTLKAIMTQDGEKSYYDVQTELADVETVKMDGDRDLQAKKKTRDQLHGQIEGMRAEVQRMEQRKTAEEKLKFYEIRRVVKVRFA